MTTSLPPIEDRDCERSILSQFLSKPERAHWMHALLDTECFVGGSHRSIYNALKQLSDDGRADFAVSHVAVIEQLRKDKTIGLLDAVGGAAGYLAELLNCEAILAEKQVRYMCGRLASLRDARRLQQISAQFSVKCCSPDADIPSYLDWLDHELTDVRNKVVSRGTDSRESLIDSYRDITTRRARRLEPGYVPMSTGIASLDAVFGGDLERQTMIGLGGRPGGGKTALACNIAAHVMNTRGVMFVSLEMAKVQILERICSIRTNVPCSLAQKLQLPPARLGEWTVGMKEIIDGRNLGIYDDTDGRSIGAIARNARAFAHDLKKQGKELGLIIVDYFQLIDVKSHPSERTDLRFGRISTALLRLSFQLDCCVLALAQLNRNAEREERKPSMADVREAGQFEQDVSQLLLLYPRNKGKNDNHNPDVRQIGVHVVKNRTGQLGDLTLSFDGPTMRFYDEY